MTWGLSSRANLFKSTKVSVHRDSSDWRQLDRDFSEVTSSRIISAGPHHDWASDSTRDYKGAARRAPIAARRAPTGLQLPNIPWASETRSLQVSDRLESDLESCGMTQKVQVAAGSDSALDRRGPPSHGPPSHGSVCILPGPGQGRSSLSETDPCRDNFWAQI